MLETWFNPVGAQSLFMPGWFRDHYGNMRRYDRMACTGSVVGTRPGATVSLDWRGRMKLKYEPHPEDLKRLVAGLKLAGRIHLAAGATKVMATTFRYLPYSSPAALEDLDNQIADNADIQLHTSHPRRQRDQPQLGAGRRRPRFRGAGRPGRLRLRRERLPRRDHSEPADDRDGPGGVRSGTDRVGRIPWGVPSSLHFTGRRRPTS